MADVHTTGPEILRSGYTPDGQRIFLMFDHALGEYQIATRWAWLGKFASFAAAAEVFEAVEFAEGDLRQFARYVKSEAKRVPASRFAADKAMSRAWFLFECAVKRAAGLRPIYCGSKGSVIDWRTARATEGSV